MMKRNHITINYVDSERGVYHGDFEELPPMDDKEIGPLCDGIEDTKMYKGKKVSSIMLIRTYNHGN